MSEERYKRIFSSNLRYYMNKSEKTQADLISDLGFDKSAVSTWCNGTRLPRMEKIDILADYFHIKASDLLEEHKKDAVSMKSSSLSDRLDEVMREKNLKQVDILKKCQPYCEEYGVKLGKSDLSQYVAGKVVPRDEKLSILALALDVDEVWLMGYDTASTSKDPSPAAADSASGTPPLSSEAIAVSYAYDAAPEGIKDSVAKLLDVKRDTASPLLKEA